MLKQTILFIFLTLLVSCTAPEPQLPYLGEPELINGVPEYPAISEFRFIDQQGLAVSNETFDTKIYVADFIFLSCPTICPKMTHEMRKVYDAFEKNENVLLLSHTIDPERDTVERLKSYSENMGIDAAKWHFVTGDRDEIYTIADSYFTAAYPDSLAEGGFVHGGGLLLVDRKRHIRGVYDGTDPSETTRLIKDINTLLNE